MTAQLIVVGIFIAAIIYTLWVDRKDTSSKHREVNEIIQAIFDLTKAETETAHALRTYHRTLHDLQITLAEIVRSDRR